LFVEASLANFEQHGYGLWLVFAREDRGFVGFAGFLCTEGEAPNLLYGIHPDFCGKGYATEAASAVLSYALESLAVPLVKADVDEPNVISVRVLEKLGMRQTRRAIVAGQPLIYYEKSRLR
jgi:RimJ/RimL family protein N-acetyltransferase